MTVNSNNITIKVGRLVIVKKASMDASRPLRFISVCRPELKLNGAWPKANQTMVRDIMAWPAKFELNPFNGLSKNARKLLDKSEVRKRPKVNQARGDLSWVGPLTQFSLTSGLPANAQKQPDHERARIQRRVTISYPGLGRTVINVSSKFQINPPSGSSRNDRPVRGQDGQAHSYPHPTSTRKIH